ncbi:MAG: hydroxyethylthiazole kinase-like uncharacterized protein yjeF [Saprospiraceae bacterium]|jgi:hydroxyethylthiazole kinase-like uncharacterized protein yjeF
MKLFLSQIIRTLSDVTIQMGTSQLNLIDNACRAFMQFIIPHLSKLQNIICICGTGNNGVDGLFIALKLSARGYQVEVASIEGRAILSTQYLQAKASIIHSQIPLTTFKPSQTIPDLHKCDVIIDSILGNGLNRPLNDIYARLIKHINSLNKKIFAIDIPSGMRAEGEIEGEILQCFGTMAFQFPRLSFFQREAAPYIGIWQYGPIGISNKLIQEANSKHFLIDQDLIRNFLRERASHSHKGSFGHTLFIGGTIGMAGAITLSARASIKIGSGKCTIMSFEGNREISQTLLPEASFRSIEKSVSDFRRLTVGIGPGLGINSVAEAVLRNILKKSKEPMIFDADALNLLSENPNLLHIVPKYSILTPHTGEFHSLFGTYSSDYQRFEVQGKEAIKHSIFIVLKGKHTTIACPNGDFYHNSTGHVGMATGGSGDVLTGMITGLLAQGHPPKEAALLGVYLHSLSGDIATGNLGEMSLMASDIIDHLPQAISKLTD